MTNRQWLESLHPAYLHSFFKWVMKNYTNLKEIGGENWFNQEYREIIL